MYNMFGAKPFGTPFASSTRFGTSTEISLSCQQQQEIISSSTATNFEFKIETNANFGHQQTGLVEPDPNAYRTSTTEKEFTFNFGSSQEGFSSMQTEPSFSGYRNVLNESSFITLGHCRTSSNTIQTRQQIQTSRHSTYDFVFFRKSKQTKNTEDHMLQPGNPAVPYKVSNRPISGVFNGGKSQLFDGLEDDDFSFGNDTFVPHKSVKKLVIKKTGENDSSISSRASSIAEESSIPQTEPIAIQHSTFISRSTPDHVIQQNLEEERFDTENIIRSKEMPDPISDTPNKDVVDTIALLNARNKGTSQEPSLKLQDTSVLSHSNASESDAMEERPTTPPPPHPAGIILSRPGYFTLPNLEELAEMVDENGDCFVENFTVGRHSYGSIYFPGVTNVANLNLDTIVEFQWRKVVVYPDDDNKPPVGKGLNKEAEITLDCVWPRDKSVGTPIKEFEKLKAMKWQDKLEKDSIRNGTEFLDYRSETGSWVFKVKHFSKYGLLDDMDDEKKSE